MHKLFCVVALACGTFIATPALAQDLTGPQKNAVRSAMNYLSFAGFSRDGLIDQLSSPYGDGYDLADATTDCHSNEQCDESERRQNFLPHIAPNVEIQWLHSNPLQCRVRGAVVEPTRLAQPGSEKRGCAATTQSIAGRTGRACASGTLGVKFVIVNFQT